MPEFLQLLPPDEARSLLFSRLASVQPKVEEVETRSSLGRVTAEAVAAPHALPEFPRSTVDGYAVRSRDTFGATDTQPAYLSLVGEIPMGASAGLRIEARQCAIIHTGGMLADGADAVVMLEHTQIVARLGERADMPGEIEVLRAAAMGENTIAMGEDVAAGSVVVPAGRRMRPAEVGGLMALGILRLRVTARPRVGLISSGDEVVEPGQRPQPGQVRDVNAYSLAALIDGHGGAAVRYGIVPDDQTKLRSVAAQALAECDAVIITAGSSASTRDMTAEVIQALGQPGVLVHGINTRPGKPTILGVCDGKAVIGLPGNPVSALVNGYLFVVPLVERLLGMADAGARPSVMARLTVNLPSQAGREDWWPVRLTAARGTATGAPAHWDAEPIFGKSNLIFTLAAADGLLRIPPDATGLAAGELVEVYLL
ncbi:MAG TPA: gephyrin-like molybdotransferase Glp [Anaerolineales bacterium]|nr:gephyrin-like molybdotransferase Glp [Anaerolineales bacterium]